MFRSTGRARNRARLAAAIIALAAMPATGWSQIAPTSPGAFSTAAQPFDIPPGSLDDALQRWSRLSGIRLLIPADAVKGLQSRGLGGTFTPEQALNQLLAGSRLGYRSAGPRAVAIYELGTNTPGTMQLDPVQVQGAFPVPPQAMIDNLPPPYAGGQVATGGQLGLLGNRPVMDTPFNQTNYTAKKAQDQQAKTVRDVLIDDPSVRIMRNDNSPGADQVQIRGFPVDAPGYLYGGLLGVLPFTTTMVELAERVEVLKGPSAMLNGMPPFGYIGGTVNIVPKRAPDEPLTQATASYISAGQVGGHVDVARRFGLDKEFGVRVNGVFRAGQTELQYNSDQRGLAVVGLDFRGERVRLSADLGYQSQYIGGLVPYLALANGVPLPWAPNARSNPTAQPWGFQQRKDLFGVVRAEVDLVENVTAYAAFGAHDFRWAGVYSSVTTITNFNGAASGQQPTNFSGYASFITAEGGLRALVDTGPIGHELALTATTYYTWDGQVQVRPGSPFATNIYNPTIIGRPNIPTPAATLTSTMGLSSIGFADTLTAADKRIQLTVGGRLQQVQSANIDSTTGEQTDTYNESAFSPAVALVFKPWENVSIYGNWIQGLQPGIIVQAPFANAGEIFPPYKATQYEAGVKVDWGKFTTTASLFQISQPSILTNIANNTQFLGGEQVNQGLELNVFGEPMQGVRLLGGVMLLNGVLTQTQGGLTDGWIAPFSPSFSLNLAGEWDLPFAPGLTMNGRVVHTSSQYIDTTFPRRSLPDWTRFDIGARYAFENPGAKGKLLVARFNIDNVFDANYWAGGNGANRLFLGAPRTFRLSLTADF